MTLKRRLERVEQVQAADPYAHMSDEQLDAEVKRRTAHWSDQNWEACWAIAREMGWSEQKIANAKAVHGVER